MSKIKTHSYISSYNLPNSNELQSLLYKTDMVSYITTESSDCGDTHSLLLWQDHIEVIQGEYKDLKDDNNALTPNDTKLITLLKETLKIMEDSEAEFILFHL